MHKLPSVKEALDEVTFTFILSPFPEDYTSVSVPVTSRTTLCFINSFITSNIALFVPQQQKIQNFTLLPLSIIQNLSKFKCIYFKEHAVVRVAVLPSVLLFSPPSVLTTWTSKKEGKDSNRQQLWWKGSSILNTTTALLSETSRLSPLPLPSLFFPSFCRVRTVSLERDSRRELQDIPSQCTDFLVLQSQLNKTEQRNHVKPKLCKLLYQFSSGITSTTNLNKQIYSVLSC